MSNETSMNMGRYDGWSSTRQSYNGSLSCRRERDYLPPIQVEDGYQHRASSYGVPFSPVENSQLPPLRDVLYDLHSPSAGQVVHASPEAETFDFGDNPHYYNDSTQLGYRTPPPELSHAYSTPVTPAAPNFQFPASSRQYGHRRSWSTPSAASQSHSLYAGGASYPHPTLQPLAPHAEEGDPRQDQFMSYQYTNFYPQQPSTQRAYTAPVTPRPATPPSPSRIGGGGPNADFQPVMIFEQGQSVTGKKWRRKVTIFRSDIYQRLESEGRL